jgi:hypothetical protein
MRITTLATAFGAGRVLVGAALLATPGPITRAWVGDAGAPAQVLGRCLGARDAVIGGGLIAAVAHDRDPRPWLMGGVFADAVDGAATIASGRLTPGSGRAGTVALASASALFGAWLAHAID